MGVSENHRKPSFFLKQIMLKNLGISATFEWHMMSSWGDPDVASSELDMRRLIQTYCEGILNVAWYKYKL